MVMIGNAILFSCLFLVAVKTENSIDEDHEVVLNNEYYVKLKWQIDGSDIFAEISAETTGYVAIGFSPNGGMPGSDIVVGWVKDGEASLSDRHAIAKDKPVADLSNDYYILYGFEDDGRTTIGFKRALNTCDDNDHIINADTIRVIWAVNEFDPEDINDLRYHGVSRGVRSVILLDAPTKHAAFPEDSDYFDVYMPNVTVPSDIPTTYWCASFAVPTLEKHVHIVKIETLVQRDHLSVVHHLIVYGCHSLNVGWSGACANGNMPPDLKDCDRMVYGWAVGAGPLELPEHVGFSLGRPNDYTVIVLEIHYDNPTLSSDLHDNSGVRFHYTSTLRQYEAAIFMIGENVTPSYLWIPPNQTLFKTFAFCFEECTRKVLEEDIKIFSVLLHAHTSTVQATLQQYRDGVLIDDLVSDYNYDPNLQDLRSLVPERIIKPGDELVLTCGHNTKGRDFITTGGQSTINEMCLAYVAYYPSQTLAGSCVSTPDPLGLYETFNVPLNMCGLGNVECLLGYITSLDNNVVRDGLHNVSYKGKRVGICVDKEENFIGEHTTKDFPTWFSEHDRIKHVDMCGATTTWATTANDKIGIGNVIGKTDPETNGNTSSGNVKLKTAIFTVFVIPMLMLLKKLIELFYK